MLPQKNATKITGIFSKHVSFSLSLFEIFRVNCDIREIRWCESVNFLVICKFLPAQTIFIMPVSNIYKVFCRKILQNFTRSHVHNWPVLCTWQGVWRGSGESPCDDLNRHNSYSLKLPFMFLCAMIRLKDSSAIVACMQNIFYGKASIVDFPMACIFMILKFPCLFIMQSLKNGHRQCNHKTNLTNL